MPDDAAFVLMPCSKRDNFGEQFTGAVKVESSLRNQPTNDFRQAEK